MGRLADRLVGPMGVSTFNTEYRERNAVKFESALTQQEASGLFDVSRLQNVIAGPGSPANNIDIYRLQNLMRLSDVVRGTGRSALEVAGELLKIGCTLRVRDIDQFDRKIADFAREVAIAYASETQVNAYFTPPAQEGLPPHFDPTDAFIVQVAGAKEWLIHKEYTNQQDLPGPDVDWDAAHFVPVGPATPLSLRPGDVLYIPRGVMHSARCTNEESLHLTVTLTPMTMLMLIEAELRRLADDDIELRQRVPWSMAGGAEEIAALRGKVRSLVSKLADRIDPGAPLAECREKLDATSSEQPNIFDAATAALKPA